MENVIEHPDSRHKMYRRFGVDEFIHSYSTPSGFCDDSMIR
jgi:hypothetical protein